MISYGAMLPVATAAAARLAERGEAEVEVLDLRTLRATRRDAVLDSVARTGRAVIVHEAPRTAGFGAEVAAILAERGIPVSPRAGAARHRLRRPLSVLVARGAIRPERRTRRPCARGGPELLSDPHLIRLPDLGRGAHRRRGRQMAGRGGELGLRRPAPVSRSRRTRPWFRSPRRSPGRSPDFSSPRERAPRSARR